MTRHKTFRSTLREARRMLRGWLDFARETWDIVRETLTSHDAALLPPVWLRDVGPSDFELTGQEFLRHFTAVGHLQPSESVLDIGCGPGRMAIPLTRHLNRDGRYVGMDIVAPAIRWCRRNISRRHPSFRFHHANIKNARYNPGGTVGASDYIFPFEDRSFDFVFLASVFTHMYPSQIRHYLKEVARLLRPSGRLFCTFFLLNPAQQALARHGKNEIDFRYDHGDFWTRDQTVPESAVAVDEGAARAMVTDAGLAVREPMRYGTWSGREDGLSLQDIVVAEPLKSGSAGRG